MKFLGWTGAILAIALLLGTGCTSAAAKSTPDLSGMWRLDPALSSAPRFGDRTGGEGRRDGEGGGRRWGGMGGGGARGTGQGFDGERRRARLRLPDVMRLSQSAWGLQVSDSLGAPLGEIRTAKGKQTGNADIVRMDGSWHGDRLEVVQAGGRGQMTQTYRLADDGRTLEVKTSMQFQGGMPAREFVRVYHKEGA